jgi:hypothetical protein
LHDPWVTTDSQQDQARGQARTVPAATARAFWLAERARSSPYYPALSHPVLRRVLPGAALAGVADHDRHRVRLGTLGARGTLLASALATIALGLMTAAALARARTVAKKPGTSG